MPTKLFQGICLQSGIEIELKQYGVKLHQPTILEIALFGEEEFFYSLRLLFGGNLKKIQSSLADSIIGEEEKELILGLSDAKLLKIAYEVVQTETRTISNFFKLAFPDFEILVKHDYLFLVNREKSFILILNEEFLESLKEVWNEIYCVPVLLKEKVELKPSSDKAKKIAAKIAKSREHDSSLEPEKLSSVFGYYMSKLSTISKTISIKDSVNLTVYQLLDQFSQNLALLEHQTGVAAAIAGSKGEIKDWLKDDNINQ
jgi:hypothetical protein